MPNTKVGANQLFKNFLEESGQADIPKKEKDSLFKTWLQIPEVQAAIQTGSLQGSFDVIRDKLNAKSSVAQQNTDPAKPFRPLGMPPVAAFIVVTAVVTGLVWAGIETYKHFKKK